MAKVRLIQVPQILMALISTYHVPTAQRIQRRYAATTPALSVIHIPLCGILGITKCSVITVGLYGYRNKPMKKIFRVFNTHVEHLSYTDFNGLEAALKHYFEGRQRGMSYTLIVFEDGAKELAKLIPNSKPAMKDKLSTSA